jgi:hypothetical protein
MPTQNQRIEMWALNIIERIEGRQPVEDSRVELKTEWPEPVRAARRLAGHANPAHGEAILWLIGVQEGVGVTGAKLEEVSSWFAKVSAEFDGLAPALTDLNIPYANKTVVALHFDTSRAPFLVRNPVYGTAGGGPVELEVPWRDATGVRTARRADLLKLLMPMQELPEIEVLAGGGLSYQIPKPLYQQRAWNLVIYMYVVPLSAKRVVFPSHRSRITATLPPLGELIFDRKYFTAWKYSTTSDIPGTVTVTATEAEIVIDGPGKFQLHASCGLTDVPSDLPQAGTLSAVMVEAVSQREVVINLRLTRRNDHVYDLEPITSVKAVSEATKCRRCGFRRR